MKNTTSKRTEQMECITCSEPSELQASGFYLCKYGHLKFKGGIEASDYERSFHDGYMKATKESSTKFQTLRDEVEKKRRVCSIEQNEESEYCEDIPYNQAINDILELIDRRVRK